MRSYRSPLRASRRPGFSLLLWPSPVFFNRPADPRTCLDFRQAAPSRFLPGPLLGGVQQLFRVILVTPQPTCGFHLQQDFWTEQAILRHWSWGGEETLASSFLGSLGLSVISHLLIMAHFAPFSLVKVRFNVLGCFLLVLGKFLGNFRQLREAFVFAHVLRMSVQRRHWQTLGRLVSWSDAQPAWLYHSQTGQCRDPPVRKATSRNGLEEKGKFRAT